MNNAIRTVINTVPDVGGVYHITTDWELADSNVFNNILDSAYESSEFKNVFISEVSIPVGVTYYLRYRRIYSDGSYNEMWDKVLEVTREETPSKLILESDILINRPFVSVDRNSLLDHDSDNLVIKCSNFKGVGEGHYSTHWIIKDSLDRVKFIKLNDRLNLTTINVPKSQLTNASKLKVYCIHNTATGMESKPGVTAFSFNPSINFEVTNNLTRIHGMNDYKLNFQSTDGNPIKIERLVISEPISNIEQWVKNINNIDEAIIPADVLRHDATYKLDIYTSVDEMSYSSYEIKTVNNYIELPLLESYEYTDVESISMSGMSVLYKNSYLVERYDGSVYVPDYINGTLTRVIISDIDNSISSVENTLDDILIPTSTVNKEFNLLHTEDNHIIVDTRDVSDIPKFRVYKHNSFTKENVLIHTLTKNDEDRCNVNTNLIQIDKDTILTLGVSDSESFLRKFVFKTGETSKIPIPDLGNMSNGVMIDTHLGRVIIMGGDSNRSKVYDYRDDVWFDGPTLSDEFKNRPLKAIRMINKDYLITRETTEIGDTPNLIAKYNFKEERLYEETNTNLISKVSTSILRRTGELIMFGNEQVGNTVNNEAVVLNK